MIQVHGKGGHGAWVGQRMGVEGTYCPPNGRARVPPVGRRWSAYVLVQYSPSLFTSYLASVRLLFPRKFFSFLSL